VSRYEEGTARICDYEEAGTGFPLLAMPGGLNSRPTNWATAGQESVRS
jgi:hypothetical protein